MALGHPRSMAFHRTTPGGAGSKRKEWPGVAPLHHSASVWKKTGIFFPNRNQTFKH
jgi:hypothetical protein